MRVTSLLIGLLFATAIYTVPVSAEITNFRTYQSGDLIIVEYDLTDDTPVDAKVDLKLTVQGIEYKVKQLSMAGDIGKCESPGKGKRIVWDLRKDFPCGLDVKWEIKK